MARAVWMVLLAACSETHTHEPSPDAAPDIPPDTARSGMRLKLAWFVADDGFRTPVQPTDLYDAELGVPCEPIAWADGTTRCTPALAHPSLYFDAACTEPGFYLRDDVVFGTEQEIGCGGPRPATALYELGPTMFVTQAYQRVNGGCVPAYRPPNQTGFSLRPIATTRPPSDLVTISRGYQGGGRLTVETLLSADGLLAPWRVRDGELGVTCLVEALAGASEGPCTPAEAIRWDGTVFVDAECRDPGVPVADACPPPPLAAMSTFSCPRYYELAETPSASACETSPPVGSVYALGRYAEPPLLARAREPMPTRLSPIYVSGGDVRMRDDHRLYDGDLETECELRSEAGLALISDDALAVCRPPYEGAYLVRDRFSDPGCTQPLPLLVTTGYDTCVTGPLPRYAAAFDGAYQIGARHDGPVYEDLGGACIARGDAYYEVGAFVPEAQMARVTKRRDP